MEEQLRSYFYQRGTGSGYIISNGPPIVIERGFDGPTCWEANPVSEYAFLRVSAVSQQQLRVKCGVRKCVVCWESRRITQFSCPKLSEKPSRAR